MDESNQEHESMHETGEIEALASAEPSGNPARPEPVFYTVNAANVSIREYWWGNRSPLILIAILLLKVLRLRLPSSPDDPCVESLDPFVVDANQMPSDALDAMNKAAPSIQTLGFHSPVYHSIDDATHATRTFLASYSHATVPVVARLHMRVWSATAPAKVRFFSEYITAYKDGGYLWTMSSKADLLAPPSCHVVRAVGLEPQLLWMKHEPELRAEWPRRTAIPCATPQETLAICSRLHDEVRAFHVKRGVFVPLSEAEKSRMVAAKDLRERGAAGTLKYPDVIAEIDRLQNKRTGWKQWVLLLGLSLAAFLLLGFAKMSMLQVLALVPVLLLHEMGHYVTMRAFGYRNMKMFFVPGFGAAVTGRAFNVPGWQKVVVSLMGPLPGIVLGIIVGLCGMVWHKPWAINAGLLLASLNGFNLIPLMPLDGGHVLRTVLFSRNTVLDVIFRALAAVVLLGMFALTKSYVTMAIGIAILMGLPAMLRSARAVRQLRREGFSTVSPDNQTVPPEAADRIIDKLKGSAKVPLQNKVLAQQTLDVFEALNTRAPGWKGSVGLLSLHALAFLAAVVFSAIFLMWTRGPVGDVARAAASAPRHVLDTSAIMRTPPGGSGVIGERMVVAHMERSQDAKAAYAAASAKLAVGQTSTVIGDTVFIGLPTGDEAARKQWFDELHAKCPGTFVTGKHVRVTVSLSCLAPNQTVAESIERELREYFQLPLSGKLIAPWSPAGKWSDEHAAARRVYAKIADAEDTVWQDPEATRLNDEIRKARVQGDDAGWDTLQAQRKRFCEDAKQKRVRDVAASSDPGAGRVFADLYRALRERVPLEKWYVDGVREIVPSLGEVSADDRTWASSGNVTRTVMVLQLRYVGFEDPAAGMGALVRWLEGKGCRTFKYDLFDDGSYSGDDRDFEE